MLVQESTVDWTIQLAKKVPCRIRICTKEVQVENSKWRETNKKVPYENKQTSTNNENTRRQKC